MTIEDVGKFLDGMFIALCCDFGIDLVWRETYDHVLPQSRST